MSIELSYKIRDYSIELLFLQQEFVNRPSHELLRKMSEVRKTILSLRIEAAAEETRRILQKFTA